MCLDIEKAASDGYPKRQKLPSIHGYYRCTAPEVGPAKGMATTPAKRPAVAVMSVFMGPPPS
jgi:hypothetical protein